MIKELLVTVLATSTGKKMVKHETYRQPELQP